MSAMVRPSPTNSISVVLGLLVCLVFRTSDATIRVDYPRKVYQSRPDHNVGLQMQTGLEYKARLQRIPGDQHFCGNSHWNVTAPEDGLPVAMVVKKGLCSSAQKAEFASRNIFPKGIVKVLIIDGEARITNIDDDEYKDEVSYKLDRFKSEHLDESMSLSSYMSPTYYNTQGDSTVSLERKHADDISVTLLHVSYRTGYELLDILVNEGSDIKASGGTEVTVDAGVPPMTRAVILIWTMVSIVLSICACCGMACIVEDLLEAEEPEPDPPRRRRRKRLTIDQVRKFPIGIFDGHQLVYDDENDNVDHEIGGGCDHSIDPIDNKFIQPAAHSLDACTICLDEYVVGDKLRCLPCGHPFHGKCIGKWLVERSATCPLCNLDLYEEEPDDDDDDDDDEPGTATTAMPEEVVETFRTNGTSFRSWWRGMFRSSDGRVDRLQITEDVSRSLAEPLLSSQQQEEEFSTPEPSDANLEEALPPGGSSTISAGSNDEEERNPTSASSS